MTEFTVNLQPSNSSFTVREGQTILDAASAAGVSLPYSCKKGTCQACKGKVIEGDVILRRGALTKDDRESGFTLLCQAIPVSDIVVEARVLPAMAKPESIKAIVSGMRRAAPDVMIVSLRLPPRYGLGFMAGQYVDIILPDGARRSYSLANSPREEGSSWELELHIRHMKGGLFTDHVFDGMKEREMLSLQGPLGTFFLREDSDKPLVFVAGGTGFSPVRSIVNDALQKEIRRPMTIYWGCRSLADLYMPDEPREWAEKHANVEFVPVLSHANPEDRWEGRTGLVHEAVMKDLPDMSGYQVYACGALAMIDAARRDFVAKCNLPTEEFFADAFLTEADAENTEETV